MGCKMVTFALVSDNKKQATYHYFPEGKENNDYGIIKLDKEKQRLFIVKLADKDSICEILLDELIAARESANKIRIEEGLPELTEKEWPTPTKGFTMTVYATHAIQKIAEEYQKGVVPQNGVSIWY